MSIENAVRYRAVLYERIGKSALNVMYPNEFEYYVCALELVNANNKSLRYFIFPVMPSNLEEVQPKSTSVRKTLGGTVALSSNTFNPVDITLSGNFGRKFKVLLGSNFEDFVSAFKTPRGSSLVDKTQNAVRQIFDNRVKTGYGCLKVMEEIITEADRIDRDGPRFLIFYNLAFGTSYYVKPTSFKISMSQDYNMIHSYNLSMKGIAPLSAIENPASRYRSLQMASMTQDHMDKTVNKLSRLLTFDHDDFSYAFRI
ncbi:hypothetical protein [Chitinophaga sp. CB10]|uniref:hypothetical protein n=1 Tax=Chitinophaga sp. CB10 TaxID=1891659 RepID=UPI0025B8F866|nr:hypothetical protein [Chitinophaga sp. CB10]